MVAFEKNFGKAFDLFVKLVNGVSSSSELEKRIDLVEREVLTGILKLGKELLQAFIVLAGDGDEGATTEVEGKVLRRFAEKKTKKYRSIFGSLDITRCVYGVRDGQRIEYSAVDAKLGLPHGEQSYVLEDWQQRLCVQNPFSSGVEFFGELFGISTTIRTAELTNQKLGDVADSFVPKEPASKGTGEIIVFSADGKGVPMRSNLEERAGLKPTAWQKCHAKKQDKKKATRAKSRLAKGQVRTRKQMSYVGATYLIDRWIRTDDDILDELLRRKNQSNRPRPQGKRLLVEMSHYREDEKINGQLTLFEELERDVRNHLKMGNKPVVCLMDGQRSLWGLKEEKFPDAIGILDFLHVSEWMWKIAYCFHPETSLAAEEWVTRQLRQTLKGKIGYVVGHLKKRVSELKGKKLKTLESGIRYFNNNKKYMKYDEYLAQGFPIGSGVIEGACRHLVKDRMEQTGMRWQIEGAKAMLKTRAIYLNGNWTQFHEHRIKTEQKLLYGVSA